ncbi:hypothetical protein DM01DRAFT_1339792 [Hesseltinella vesiculosa]|uniref:Uncharacterized protein n=1 Tax=Hesseltinella vesiculosa TaxID=101127 RepID=A0A1X2G5T5_9FUNG|nr:hypothetical protein DM01DRAFT_1339792 [Hesseltinella vesiculosa]
MATYPCTAQSTKNKAKNILKSWSKLCQELIPIPAHASDDSQAAGISNMHDPHHETTQRPQLTEVHFNNVENIENIENINSITVPATPQPQASQRDDDSGSDWNDDPPLHTTFDFFDTNTEDNVNDMTEQAANNFTEESFETIDHHPDRSFVYTVHAIEEWVEDPSEEWCALSLDVLQEAKDFRSASVHLAAKGNLPDCRDLSLDFIFTMFVSSPDCFTGYLSQANRSLLEESIKPLKDEHWPDMSQSSLAAWCNKVTDVRYPTFKNILSLCTSFIQEALQSGNDDDLVASHIMTSLSPRLLRQTDSSLEDTFAHVYIDPIVDSLFSNPIFRQRWANQKLNASSSLKPDWVLYIKPRHTTHEVVTMEIKSPGKQNPAPPSDFVKMALEMKSMLLSMTNLKEMARTFGILVEGQTLRTFVMDNPSRHVFRLTELGSSSLITTLNQFGGFPLLIKQLIQIRDMALDTAKQLEAHDLAYAKGIGKRPLVSDDEVNSRRYTRQKRRSD